MKFTFAFCLAFLILFTCKSAITVIELKPLNSIVIAGKGSGQDAVKNPYAKGNCVAIISNIGENNFEIRIQKQGVPIMRATIKPNETKRLELTQGQELYFDSKLKAKATIKFKGAANYF